MIIAVLFGLICAIGVTLWLLQPVMLMKHVNRHLDVEGVYLGMEEQEVIRLVGEGEWTGGFGAHSRHYRDKGFTLFFSRDSDHRLYHKLSEIRLSDPLYSVYSVHVGDVREEAATTLRTHHFKPVADREGIYARGEIWIQLDGAPKIHSIRILFSDKKTRDKVY